MKRILILIAALLASLSLSGQEQGERSLIELNRTVLSRIKQSIQRGDAEYLPAYRQLVADADNLLTKGPYTVMSKKQVPPSGDKHDYVSRGPYWWPDPSKPDGLPYIRKDGLTNPEYYDFPDHTELHRMTGAVYKLGLAYYYTG